jgi:folate-binding protein YgfZ
MHPSEEFPGEFETDVVAFIDPRTSQMGVRVLCVEDSLHIDDPEIKRIESSEEYDIIRQMLGIPEGSKELGNQFPLNMHMHYLNGVSFEKGCYIGQELTQRTFHTGMIRRVALPFLVVSKAEDINK